MHAIYSLVAGPLAWAAFVLFFGGILFRLIQLLMMVSKTEKFIFSYMSLKYSLRSIVHWMVPFATANWRQHPVLTVVTFVFHLCLVITPIFLLSHMVLLDESWSLSWWTLPDAVADVMTVLVIISCLFFLIRRVSRPEVQFVTDWTDYCILAIVAAPFVTGFLAYHHYAVQWMTILHMFCGEVMLAAIPFTRLSHMIFSPLTRAYMGSEFGKVRHARDW
ncbi:MAG: nitrate reductase [Desulfobacteraceae bacterium]|jgi:nitrate reductase gamma subunit